MISGVYCVAFVGWKINQTLPNIFDFTDKIGLLVDFVLRFSSLS